MNVQTREMMSAHAKQVSSRYAIEKTVMQTVALYEQLCEQRPDLQREKEHGRWMLRERSRPLVKQLGGLLRSPERGEGLRWWEVDWFEDKDEEGERARG